jgi:hypothetical protein
MRPASVRAAGHDRPFAKRPAATATSRLAITRAVAATFDDVRRAPLAMPTLIGDALPIILAVNVAEEIVPLRVGVGLILGGSRIPS